MDTTAGHGDLMEAPQGPGRPRRTRRGREVFLPLDLHDQWQALMERHRQAHADMGQLLARDQAAGHLTPELEQAALDMTAAGDAAHAFWLAHIAPRIRRPSTM